MSVLSRFRMGGGGERTAAATNRGGATCGIIVYFRGRGRTAALPGALSGTAWPQCADRWRIADDGRARAFAPHPVPQSLAPNALGNPRPWRGHWHQQLLPTPYGRQYLRWR